MSGGWRGRDSLTTFRRTDGGVVFQVPRATLPHRLHLPLTTSVPLTGLSRLLAQAFGSGSELALELELLLLLPTSLSLLAAIGNSSSSFSLLASSPSCYWRLQYGRNAPVRLTGMFADRSKDQVSGPWLEAVGSRSHHGPAARRPSTQSCCDTCDDARPRHRMHYDFAAHAMLSLRHMRSGAHMESGTEVDGSTYKKSYSYKDEGIGT